MNLEPTDSATMDEMLRTSAKLVADPELKRKVEDEQRAMLLPGESFYIDKMGIGHFWGSLHVSSMPIIDNIRQQFEKHADTMGRLRALVSDHVEFEELPPFAYGVFSYDAAKKCLILYDDGKMADPLPGNQPGEVRIPMGDYTITEFETIVKDVVTVFGGMDGFEALVILRTVHANGDIEAGMALAFGG